LIGLFTYNLAKKDNMRIYSDTYDLATDIKEKKSLLGNRYPAITVEEVEYIESTDRFHLSGVIPKACSKLKNEFGIPCDSGVLIVENASKSKFFFEHKDYIEKQKEKAEFIDANS
tara:strand:+ start:930 stop:1274 length:345 start_codon:yes stop_codon:yes gene_type:complete